MSYEEQDQSAADYIYHEWNKALQKNDIEGLVSLYAEDAVIESPLIPHLLNLDTGICRGRSEIRTLVEEVAKRKPNIRKYYRSGFLKMGNTIMWEYPRKTPQGEQMDFVEVMDLTDEGLIQYHRVYWGWRGVKVLHSDGYHNA